MLSEDELRLLEDIAGLGACSPYDVRQLIAEMRRLQEANAKLRAACEAWLLRVDDMWADCGTWEETVALTREAVEEGRAAAQGTAADPGRTGSG
jgi:hypothetical protein